MILRQEIKATAKESLKGRWGFSIGLLLVMFLIPIVLNIIPLVGTIIVLVIYPALTFIPQELFLKVKRSEETQIGDVFSSIFSKLGTYWGIAVRAFLKILPWFVLMIIGNILMISGTVGAVTSLVADISSVATSGSSIMSILGSIIFIVGYILTFTNSLYYVLSIYVKADKPELTCLEAVMESKELMTGHRLEYFILTLSFFGWILVGTITFGIGYLYVIPYMYTTFAAFYDALKETNTTVEPSSEAIQF